MIFEFLLHGFCRVWVTIKRLQSARSLQQIQMQAPGYVPFFEQKIQELFKDFQGHISHFPRTPFNAKKSLESMSFLFLSQHKQLYPEDLSVLAPFRYMGIRVGQSKHRNSRTFQQRLQFSRIFKALNFYFKI